MNLLQLFSFADRFRGQYDDSIQSARQYYTSSGYTVSNSFSSNFSSSQILDVSCKLFSKPTSGLVKDELLWAAAWLFRATGDKYYLKYVVDNAVSMGGTGWAVREFSWDNKYAGVQILLSKVIKSSHHPFKMIPIV